MQSDWKAAIQKYTKALRYLAPDSFEVEDEPEKEQAKQLAEASIPALLNRHAPWRLAQPQTGSPARQLAISAQA